MKLHKLCQKNLSNQTSEKKNEIKRRLHKLQLDFFFFHKNMSDSIEDLLEIILLQEEKCCFDTFTSPDALKIGLMLIENATPFNKPVIIDIELNGHQLFHYAMQGTTKDNDEWVRRKK